MNILQDVTNPFTDGIVADPWAFDVTRTPDVEGVHAGAFSRCLHLLEREVRRRNNTSLLVHGTTGSGKTHLVARLLRHLARPDGPGLPCWVIMEPINRDRLWSWVRKSLVRDLLRPYPTGVTPLVRLLGHRLPNLSLDARREGRGLLEWLAGALTKPKQAQIRQRLEEELYAKVRISAELRAVLKMFFSDQKEDKQAARDWLLGESLPPGTLHRLGLDPAAPNDLAKEEQSRELVLSLCRLTDPGLPLVFCFDQLESLMQTVRDDEGLWKCAQVLNKLRHEAGSSLLLVSFIRTDYRDQLKAVIGQAHWDRIAENETSLSPLTWEQAAELVLRRMSAVPDLKALRQGQNDPYWPLGKQRVQELFLRYRYGCTPREMLSDCKKAFDKLLPTDPERKTLPQWLLGLWAQRRQQKQGADDPERLERLLIALPWLVQLLCGEHQRFESEELSRQLPDANLFLQAPGGELIAFCACPKRPQVWQRFQRLHKHWEAHLRLPIRCNRLLVLCDVETSDFLTATRKRLDDLCRLKGVERLTPSADKLIALEALHSLLSDAHNGSLAYEGESVRAEAVDEWARAGIMEPLNPLGLLRDFLDDLGVEVAAPPAGTPAAGVVLSTSAHPGSL